MERFVMLGNPPFSLATCCNAFSKQNGHPKVAEMPMLIGFLRWLPFVDACPARPRGLMLLRAPSRRANVRSLPKQLKLSSLGTDGPLFAPSHPFTDVTFATLGGLIRL
jgi:hypothetical protein